MRSASCAPLINQPLPTKGKTRVEAQFPRLDKLHLEKGVFILQTRPYEKVVFRNVVLQPDSKSAAAEEVSVRLRSEKDLWREDEAPLLRADVLNAGTRQLTTSVNARLWRIQVDGVWYRGPDNVGPGVEFDATHPLKNLPVLLDHLSWSTAHANETGTEQFGGGGISMPKDFKRQALTLLTGKHTVRLAIFALPTQTGGTTVVRAISNPVAIEIGFAQKSPPGNASARLWVTKEQIARIEALIKNAPVTTQLLAELFELRPGSQSVYRLRSVVTPYAIMPVEKSALDFIPLGYVYYSAAGKQFYIQWDGLGASTLHYYGPFHGDPAKTLGLSPTAPPQSSDKSAKQPEPKESWGTSKTVCKFVSDL